MNNILTLLDNLIVYGLVPRNMGPDGFRSVTARLDELADLGVNALWLSPINASPAGDFGYAVTDYLKLRPEYGSEADFKTLVQAAHARGIRVVMDFVPNHTSAQHPYFLDAQARGKASSYYAFYDRHADGEPTHYFDWQHLPNLNYDNPAVAQWMLSALMYWVREFDVDGFRLDAVWGMKERKPELWPAWSRELKQLKPDLLLLAEASARDPYYFTHGFDAAYDWTDELGHWAWEHVFEDEAQLGSRLHAALTNEGRGYHPEARIFRFLNNNDTGARFNTRYGIGMTRVAAALLLTLPGIPCIYMGEEVGAGYEPYKTPDPICWDDPHNLRDYYKRLVALRHRLPSLRSHAWYPLTIGGVPNVYGYLRGEGLQYERVLVLLNFSDTPSTVEIDVTPHLQYFAAGSLTDLLADEQIISEQRQRLEVPMSPWSSRVLVGSNR